MFPEHRFSRYLLFKKVHGDEVSLLDSLPRLLTVESSESIPVLRSIPIKFLSIHVEVLIGGRSKGSTNTHF